MRQAKHHSAHDHAIGTCTCIAVRLEAVSIVISSVTIATRDSSGRGPYGWKYDANIVREHLPAHEAIFTD